MSLKKHFAGLKSNELEIIDKHVSEDRSESLANPDSEPFEDAEMINEDPEAVHLQPDHMLNFHKGTKALPR